MKFVVFLVIGFVVGALLVRSFRSVTIFPGSTGLLYRKGQFERVLEAGYQRWFDPYGQTVAAIVPSQAEPLFARELTVMSKDQFAFRLTVTPVCQIIDARAYQDSISAGGIITPVGYLNGLSFARLDSALSAAVIAWAGQRSLDEFLANPQDGLSELRNLLADVTPGAEVKELLLTGIIMPPEIRKMFTEVERARREGLAALERARSEQASLRALANAARSMESNPQLAQLRLLQVMESAKGTTTFVLGNSGIGIDMPPRDMPQRKGEN